MAKNVGKKKFNTTLLVRTLCIVLAVLLVGASLIGSLIGAFAEEAPRTADACTASVEFLENEQALRITQRFVVHNPLDKPLTRFAFYAMPNLYRNLDTLPWTDETLTALFPEGFVPGSVEITRVTAGGEDVRWAYANADCTELHIYADVPANGTLDCNFEYYVLLTRNKTSIGISDIGVRLTNVLLTPAMPDAAYLEWAVTPPLGFTDVLMTPRADWDVTLTLPEGYTAGGTGTAERLSGTQTRFTAKGVRGFAIAFSKKYNTVASGKITVLSKEKKPAAAAYAEKALTILEEKLGALPCGTLTLIQSDDPAQTVAAAGVVLYPTAVKDTALKLQIGEALARQYIGLTVMPDPVEDAWIADTVCSYLSLLLLKEIDGESAFAKALNDKVLDALNITVPGGLFITSSARLFTAEEYDIIVLRRGTAVMHEMALITGEEGFWEAIRLFVQTADTIDVPTEMDFLNAFNTASGRDLEAALTDYLFNIDEYIDAQLEVYE